ncbi:MAG: hypothetical protein RL367_314 [Pseudomonadota bacterium]|jgi:hypothetical protein
MILPAFLPALPAIAIETVESLPDQLEGAIAVGPYSQARPGAWLRVVPGLARFLVTDGARLQVAIEDGADLDHVMALIHGPATAALIYQRGEFPLHAATLVAPGGDRAVAIMGQKGAGKSTQAYALIDSGWRLLNDDLSRISIVEGRVLVWPGRPGIRLCKDACDRYGLDTGTMARAGGEGEKYVAPVQPLAGPVALHAMVEIDRGGGRAIEKLASLSAIATVSGHTFRPNYIRALDVAQGQLSLVARIIGSCAVWHLPVGGSPQDFAAGIETALFGLQE